MNLNAMKRGSDYQEIRKLVLREKPKALYLCQFRNDGSIFVVRNDLRANSNEWFARFVMSPTSEKEINERLSAVQSIILQANQNVQVGRVKELMVSGSSEFPVHTSVYTPLKIIVFRPSALYSGKKLLVRNTFHEFCHVRYDTALGMRQLGNMRAIYEKMMETEGEIPFPKDSRPEYSPPSDWYRMQEKPLISLFTEGGYTNSSDGHPYSSSSELFSSASTILMFFLDKLFFRIGQLDSARKKVADEVVQIVASCWKNTLLLPKEIYGR